QNFDYDKVKADEQAFKDRLAAFARRHHKGELVGEIARFGRGDGFAEYMVFSEKPLSLIWIPLGDAWSIPEAHARGLRLADIRENIGRQRGLRALFSAQ
ncbi:hypothetical protein V6O07_11525, partial [Arthrospira platensis SPKY2]